jgi:hypothetical protein
MNAIFSNYWVLFASAWMFVNGLLHDIFILIRHKGAYDRDLLRLLMDGHVLMLSGAILLVVYFMLQQRISYGAVIGIITATGMLVYCAMIFPFLKSNVTTLISLMVLVVSVRALIIFPSFQQIIQTQK